MCTFGVADDRHQSGLEHLDRYRCHGDKADLEVAIDDLWEAFTQTPTQVIGVDLADALIDGHDREGARAGDDRLDRALALLERPEVGVTPRGRNLLAHALLERYERDGNPDDQLRATTLRRAAGDEEAERLVHLDASMINLGIDLPDLADGAAASKAVEVLRAHVAATPAEHTDLGNRLTNLGSALLRHSEWRGRDEALNEAIQCFVAAATTRQGFAVHGYSWLGNLGNALMTRFDRNGATSDLDQAIDSYLRSVEICQAESPALPACLSNLANALVDRFELAGDPHDLTMGISHLRTAIDHTPPTGVQRAARLSNLCTGLLASFETTGELDDLTEAIDVCRQAIAVAAPNSTDAPRWNTNLGNALMAAYRMGDAAALGPAIEAYSRAVERVAPHDRERALYVNNLGTALQSRADEASVRTAITLFIEALADTPRRAPRRALQLNNLANAYTELYALTGRRSQLRRAIRLYRRALRATPRQAPEYAAWSYNLASTLASLLRDRRLPLGTGRLRARYRRTCAIARETSPDTYLAAARSWAYWAEHRGTWSESAQAYRQATSAVRDLVEVQLLWSQKTRWLAGTLDLVARSAYAHLRAGQPHQAVLEIEHGRAVLLAEVLEHAALVRFAAKKGSPLADKMNQLAAKARVLRMHTPDRASVSSARVDGYDDWPDDPATDIAARRRLREELRATVADIRKLVGIDTRSGP